ncbi:MAG: RDD family protein [Candidatus Hodarchaeales archaeon]|jgi:uncharacterized RDD family membrane protein YckC
MENKTYSKYFLKQRIFAYFIDYILVLSVLITGFLPVVFFAAFEDWDFNTIRTIYFIIFFPLISILYYMISEIKLSQTLGKKFYSIGIVDEGSSEHITVKQSIIRNLLKFLPWLVIIDFIMGYFMRPSNQRALGILSKTKVDVMEGFSFKRYANPREQKNVVMAFRIVLTLLGAFFVLLILFSPILTIITL